MVNHIAIKLIQKVPNTEKDDGCTFNHNALKCILNQFK